MRHRLRLTRFICVLLAVCLIAVTSLAYAESESYSGIIGTSQDDYEVYDRRPTGEGMFADLIFLRTVGLAGTIVGTAVFIVTLPFTLPTNSVKKAAKKLVVAPAKFTFARPLGEI